MESCHFGRCVGVYHVCVVAILNADIVSFLQLNQYFFYTNRCGADTVMMIKQEFKTKIKYLKSLSENRRKMFKVTHPRNHCIRFHTTLLLFLFNFFHLSNRNYFTVHYNLCLPHFLLSHPKIPSNKQKSLSLSEIFPINFVPTGIFSKEDCIILR